MKLKIRFEYSDKTSCFELKLFFKSLYKISVDFTNICKISERSAYCINVKLYAGKKRETQRYVFMMMLAKTC